MKIKKNAKIVTDDFWYDLFEGGYIKPQEILEDVQDCDKVQEAISTLRGFRNAVGNIIEYM